MWQTDATEVSRSKNFFAFVVDRLQGWMRRREKLILFYNCPFIITITVHNLESRSWATTHSRHSHLSVIMKSRASTLQRQCRSLSSLASTYSRTRPLVVGRRVESVSSAASKLRLQSRSILSASRQDGVRYQSSAAATQCAQTVVPCGLIWG